MNNDVPARRQKKSAAAFSALLFAILTVTLAAGSGHDRWDDDDHDRDHDDGRHGTYAIGLWGDLPYADLQATVGVPNLIADMNRQDLKFTVHDGDLKVGSGVPNSTTPTTCSDAMYLQALGFLKALRAPAMFTPGDNDWTDCDRPANGNFNSLERLDHERALFFSTPFSFGQHKMRLEVQDASTTPCKGFVSGTVAGTTAYKDVPCVENRRWSHRGVT